MMETSFLKIPLAPLGPDHSDDHPVPEAGAMSHLEKSLAVHWEIMTSQFSPGTSWKYMEIYGNIWKFLVFLRTHYMVDIDDSGNAAGSWKSMDIRCIKNIWNQQMEIPAGFQTL